MLHHVKIAMGGTRVLKYSCLNIVHIASQTAAVQNNVLYTISM